MAGAEWRAAHGARSPPLAGGRVPPLPTAPPVCWLGSRCLRPRPMASTSACSAWARCGCGASRCGAPPAAYFPSAAAKGEWGRVCAEARGWAAAGCERRAEAVSGLGVLPTPRSGHSAFFSNYRCSFLRTTVQSENIKGFLVQRLSYPHSLPQSTVSSVFCMGRQTQVYIWSSLTYLYLAFYSASWRSS